MNRLDHLVPDVETFLELEAAEVAGVILEQLNETRDSSMLFLSQYANASHQCHFNRYPSQHWRIVSYRLMEGWSWLIANGLLASDANHANDKYFVTRLGQQVADAAKVREYRKAMQLPRERLHPLIADRCAAQFLRGEFDTAVFEAYRALEVRIRDATALTDSDYGVTLARKAFHPDQGPLTDKDALLAEREALSNLVAGAIGSYKNPVSHRRIAVNADEAAEMIILASHLLRVVYSRTKLGGAHALAEGK